MEDRVVLRRLAAAVVLAMLVLWAGACDGGGEPQAPTSTNTVAPTQVVAQPTATPPPCQATDLIAGWSTAVGATGGVLLASVGIANRSNVPCVIETPPAIRLRGANGEALLLTVDDREPCPAPVACAEFEPIELPPGHEGFDFGSTFSSHATFRVSWQDHDMTTGRCDPAPTQYTEGYVVLPGGDEVEIQSGSSVDFMGGPPAPCEGTLVIFEYHGPERPGG